MKAKTAVALLSLVLTMPALAADVAELLRKAQQEIEGRNADIALQYLAEAETYAETAGDQARTQFLMARAYELADRIDDAKSAYRKALDADPKYGAALNNLAQLEAGEDPATAMQLFDRAVALNDDRQLLYKYNLAGIVDRERAYTLYKEILAARPGDIDVQSRLIRVSEPYPAVDGLRAMLKEGATRDAAALALSLAADPRFKETARSLLAVAVEGLARQRIPLDEFDASPAAEQLAQLRSDPKLKDGVRQIRLVYDRAPVGAAAFSWWTTNTECADAIARLLRESAAQSVRAGDTAAAEIAYRAALDIKEGADPDAFLQLANLLYSKDRKAELSALEAKYREPMFGGKSDAMFHGDSDKAYRFHIALGTLYTYVENYGDSSKPNSAIFQLEEAKRDAAKLNRAVDPQAVEFLARGYEKTGRVAQAVDVRLGAAEEYKAKGQLNTAARTIDPVVAKVDSLTPEIRTRYETLARTLPMKGRGLEEPIVPKDDIQIEQKPLQWKKWYKPPLKPAVPEDDIRKMLGQYYPQLSVEEQNDLRKKLIEKYGIKKIVTDFKTMADVTMLDETGQMVTTPVRLGMTDPSFHSFEGIESLVRKLFATKDPKTQNEIMKELKALGVERVQPQGNARAIVTVKGVNNQISTITVNLE
jgi:tetratricopeptide (TPR) repeat protein